MKLIEGLLYLVVICITVWIVMIWAPPFNEEKPNCEVRIVGPSRDDSTCLLICGHAWFATMSPSRCEWREKEILYQDRK